MAKYLAGAFGLVMTLSLFSGSVAHATDDPTAPLNWKKPQQQNSKPVKKRYPLPSVQSIVCEGGKDSCYAIINNEIVVRGETVSGYKVTNIVSEAVRVTRGGKQWDLGVFPLEFKQ